VAELAGSIHRVIEVENLGIPLPDGCRLAARAWMPADAARTPVPAILEYIPYRKRDQTSVRDEGFHPWIAARGYACVRVDLRGSGDSDGVMLDEYLETELADGEAVIAWLAAQPWCDGSVGMIGISWGGINGLQLAARRPPALKAIIAICFTDDRYRDDVHFRGGCLLPDNLTWSAAMMAYNSRPPDPKLVGDRWRGMWMQRLEQAPLLAANWLRHPTRDAFWRHGSICDDFSAVRIPVLAVGGWADAYAGAVPAVLQGLNAPRAGLLGPWGHLYPHIGVPDPAIDFHDEMLCWWDRWLKGIGNEVDRRPGYRVYLRDGLGAPGDARHSGQWIAEPQWPSQSVRMEAWSLTAKGRLQPGAGGRGDTALEVRSPHTVGLDAGRFMPKLAPQDLPADQARDDAGSLCFDTAALASPFTLLGAPVLELDIAADAPQAQLAVRLCDVGPDGVSQRMTIGLLNLSHRNGHGAPQPLVPGQRVRVRVSMEHLAWRLHRGHRMRLALSTAYWPRVWPAPTPVTLIVWPGSARLLLPLRTTSGAPDPVFAPPQSQPVDPPVQLGEPRIARERLMDDTDGTVTLRWLDDSGLRRYGSHGLEMRTRGDERYRIHPDDPLRARVDAHWLTEVGRGDWRVATEIHQGMHADAEHFHVEAELVAREGDREVHRRKWKESFPRTGL